MYETAHGWTHGRTYLLGHEGGARGDGDVGVVVLPVHAEARALHRRHLIN